LCTLGCPLLLGIDVKPSIAEILKGCYNIQGVGCPWGYGVGEGSCGGPFANLPVMWSIHVHGKGSSAVRHVEKEEQAPLMTSGCPCLSKHESQARLVHHYGNRYMYVVMCKSLWCTDTFPVPRLGLYIGGCKCMSGYVQGFADEYVCTSGLVYVNICFWCGTDLLT
jgi:hypothetical protein